MSTMRAGRVAACLIALVLSVATAAPAGAQTHVKSPSQTHV